MKRILTLLMIVCAAFVANGQSLEELKAQKASLDAMKSEAEAKAQDLGSQIASLDDQIKKLSGWYTGLNGLLGFDFGESSNWAGNPNPNSSSSALNLGATLFANKWREKTFWNNKAIVTKSWLDVNTGEEDDDERGLFDNSTVDIVNASSLYGYRIHPKLALSGLGELNTSLERFMEVGTLDLGVGATWTPITNLTVVVHPLNYRVAFAPDNINVSGGLGAKLRADYARSFDIGGRTFAWNSTLTGFVPYSTKEGDVSTQEFTWLNGISFELIKGIGVGVNLGLRDAEFEYNDGLQSFYSVGLTYGFNY